MKNDRRVRSDRVELRRDGAADDQDGHHWLCNLHGDLRLGDSGSALDKLTSITYPSGSWVNYGYASNGAVSSITVNPVNSNGWGSLGQPKRS